MHFILICMLSMLSACYGRHFNCTIICLNRRNRSILTHQDDPEEEDNVKIGSSRCYGEVCVATTHRYNRNEVPKAWSVPVHGSSHDHGDENLCKDQSYTAEVRTMYDITEIRDIDEDKGFVEIDMYLQMTWEDPELGVCVCDQKFRSEDGEYTVGSNLEDDIWIPDLHVWNFKSFKRIKGLVPLSDMEIKVSKDCPAIITFGYDFQVKLRCEMSMKYYPYDQNICHFKVGSFSHPKDEVLFYNSEKIGDNSFADYKDYKFKVLPLCDHATEETVKNVAGEDTVFKVSGFSLVIGRDPMKCLAEYVLVLVLLVFTAICTAGLPLESSGRSGIVSSIALSVVFILILVNDTTPHGGGNTNLVLIYGIVSLIFVLLIYIEYCVLKAILRWPNILHFFIQVRTDTPAIKRKVKIVDKVLFAIILSSYVIYSVLFWLTSSNPFLPPSSQCHNEKTDTDCFIETKVF